jgi:16S rRNA (cytosine1402-N4)-methyltransferase
MQSDQPAPEPAGRNGHLPVLLPETIRGLAVVPGGLYIDCTLGGASHAIAVLNASAPDGRLLGIDADPEAVSRCRKRLVSYLHRVEIVQANFGELEDVARSTGFRQADGILFDLGMSSYQLASAERGFSFVRDGPLDMRFDTGQTRTAADLVNNLPERELADLLWRFGEERRSRRIAREIVARRPLTTTHELVAAVTAVVGGKGRIHPATRAFMALRIATNDELLRLQHALPQAVRLLRPGTGRLALLSYHSLEDRLVKLWFREQASECLCPPEVPHCVCGHTASIRILSRKPIRPAAAEVAANPRSRSAKLRIAERLLEN